MRVTVCVPLLSVRFFRKQFEEVPGVFCEEYYYDYIDRMAALALVSIFRQDFYKVRVYLWLWPE